MTVGKQGSFSDNKKQYLRCSFCGKNQNDVKTLIAGPGVYICDECVSSCGEIVEEKKVSEQMTTMSNEFKPVKEFGLLVDGSMSITEVGDWIDEIRYVHECLRTYGINWLQCYKNGKLVDSWNAQYVAFITWENKR